jgi:hypothetical protein
LFSFNKFKILLSEKFETCDWNEITSMLPLLNQFIIELRENKMERIDENDIRLAREKKIPSNQMNNVVCV